MKTAVAMGSLSSHHLQLPPLLANRRLRTVIGAADDNFVRCSIAAIDEFCGIVLSTMTRKGGDH
ncbi:MAG TPA: hypothetical protein VHN58_08790 [Croceicoccus sp.]|nr:hypothetical protein [Croceicoccus sp.]